MQDLLGLRGSRSLLQVPAPAPSSGPAVAAPAYCGPSRSIPGGMARARRRTRRWAAGPPAVRSCALASGFAVPMPSWEVFL